MKIHAIHHVSYEGLGLIDEWITENNIEISHSRMYDSPSLPPLDQFDGLIIMGGPMSVGDEQEFPWLNDEKALISSAIEEQKKVLGICLGSQLVAECLGSKVYKNHTPEIGWFPVKKTFLFHSWFTIFDDKEEEVMFHWHNDTFDIPEGAIRLFKSDACENQAFQYDDHVLALQFHPEMNLDIVESLLKHYGNGLAPKRYVQNAEKILKSVNLHHEKNKEMLFDLLSCFFLE
jgi:GMP synthase-like glutamine amidotransferase